ncbi:TcpE family conjugal transfer membrane protein [Microbispora sp. H13382]|uniref:TcpE family conjugal transfer membrane protein n=1 Tax=Microbispora sp. H13382 TaxID=2729112 RepID=UPI0016020F7B|nr:TcpE family conjugal transfer membrane protein [Microbispora sp. H13382]
MDLPTYTNIWRIEKRLYKLYDLRLPMPLPVVWIGVFVGVSVPWWVFLYLIGLPFAAPWHVIYLVPPGVLTWLSTRPVIESKRLTELLQSQLRYMSEPRTWCRMAPFDEPDEVALTARVWRTTPPAVAGNGRAARKARRAVSVKVPVPEVSATGARPASGAAVRAGARQVDPSRVVRPAVAAAAAAAAPVVADTPAPIPATTSAKTARGGAGATGERVLYLPEPSAPPVREEARGGYATGPEREREQQHESHERHEGHERGPVTAASHAAPAAPAEAPDAPAVPPIGTEALRRLRRLAASAEPRAIGHSGVTPFAEAPPRPGEQAAEETPAEETPGEEAQTEEAPSAPQESAGGERDAEALEQHRKGRPPRLVRPRVPGDAWGETSRTSSPEPERTPPAADEAPAATEDAATGDAETGDAETDEPATVAPAATDLPAEPTTADAGSSPDATREGTHTPGSRPYESAGGAPRGTTPGGTGAGPAVTPPAAPAGVSIRAVPAGPRAAGPAGPARPSLPAAHRTTPGRPAHEEPPRLRRVEAVVGRDTSGGWRRLAQVVVGGSRTDGMEVDEARARVPLTSSSRIMVLGCTGGAGQTTTALMLGHTLARYREDRVLALDANTGEDTLTTRIAADSPETLSSLIESSEEVTGYLGMRAYTTRCESGLEVVGADTDDRVTQRLADRAFLADWRRTLAALDRHYRLTVIDPAAALAARLLPYADQLVLVAPASEDASEAVAMTYEWLDGHGCSDLRRRAVMVINGVSRRSLPEVEQAEAVASGRCRAIVRVPWEDELAPGRPGPVDVNHLRIGGRRAYVALAGVIVSGLATVQAKQEVAR